MRGSIACVLVCASFLGASAFAESGFEMKQQTTFEAALSEGGLKVESTLGDVTIKADATATTIKAVAIRHVRADTEEIAKELMGLMEPTLTPNGSEAVVANSGFKKNKTVSDGRNLSMSVDWVITVPPGAKIDVESSLGDVEVLGVIAGVEVDAAMGDIDVQAGGRLSLNCSMGDVEVKLLGSPAPMELNSSMGDVDVTVPMEGWGKIDAATSYGEVEARDWSGTARQWQTSNSHLHAEFDGAGPALIANSSMGDVTIKFEK